MRLSLMCAALAASLLVVGVAQSQTGAPLGARPASPPVGPVGAPAAAAPRTSSPVDVVVIDIAFIFKNHLRFNAKMNELKRQADEYEAYMREESKKLNAKREELAQFKPGTAEYKQKEVELAQMQSKLQVDMTLKRKEFMELQAKNYYDTYKEIEREVASFAERNQIRMVLRYSADEMKPDDPNSVMQGIGRAVVYQQGLDITDHILQKVNGPVAMQPGPAGALPGGQVPGGQIPGGVAPRAPAGGPVIPQRTIQR